MEKEKTIFEKAQEKMDAARAETAARITAMKETMAARRAETAERIADRKVTAKIITNDSATIEEIDAQMAKLTAKKEEILAKQSLNSSPVEEAK